MSGGADGFDARLRRHFAAIDTTPEFEARLMARIASLRAEPEALVRARIDRRRETLRQRLVREAALNAATATGIGAALVAVVWHEAPSVTRWVEHALSHGTGSLAGVAFTALGLGLWVALQRLAPR